MQACRRFATAVFPDYLMRIRLESEKALIQAGLGRTVVSFADTGLLEAPALETLALLPARH